MKNDFIDIRCEGDAEQFARTATKLVQDKTPSTITLRVPTDWWINFTMALFVKESERLDIPEEEETYVDVVFDVRDTRSFRDLESLSDDEIQGLIEEFLEDLEDLEDEDKDDNDA